MSCTECQAGPGPGPDVLDKLHILGLHAVKQLFNLFPVSTRLSAERNAAILHKIGRAN